MINNLRNYWDNYVQVMEEKAIDLIKKAGGSMPLLEFEDHYLPPYGSVLYMHLVRSGIAITYDFDMTIHLREKTKTVGGDYGRFDKIKEEIS